MRFPNSILTSIEKTQLFLFPLKNILPKLSTIAYLIPRRFGYFCKWG